MAVRIYGQPTPIFVIQVVYCAEDSHERQLVVFVVKLKNKNT